MRLALFVALLIPACFAQKLVTYRAEVERWRAAREQQLKAEDGWLSVAGLFWLKQGDNRIGTDPACEITLPADTAAPNAGVVTLSGGRARVRLAGRESSELYSDTSGHPNAVPIGRLKLLLISRGGRYAIRLKDNLSAMRRNFAGLHWYPVDESWRILAKFRAYPKARKLVFNTVAGVKEEMANPGYVSFVHNGQEYRLDAASEGPGLFFVFRDGTSGKTTYGGARFLNAEAPRNGVVILDFNRAVNPPCAFTPYATCPLPPPQNSIKLPITAGEMKYEGGAH